MRDITALLDPVSRLRPAGHSASKFQAGGFSKEIIMQLGGRDIGPGRLTFQEVVERRLRRGSGQKEEARLFSKWREKNDGGWEEEN